MNGSSQYFIDKLNLQKHPEGGYFSETYRCQEAVLAEALPQPFHGDRNISTAIYFLLEGDQFSAFHRIKSDEVWHFYFGIPLNVYIIHPNGELEVMKIGSPLDDGCNFQGVVKAGCWFASKPINTEGFSLVGCTVAPGFDFEDFELAGPELARQFPQHSELISKLIRC
jgi:hypothetical protein